MELDNEAEKRALTLKTCTTVGHLFRLDHKIANALNRLFTGQIVQKSRTIEKRFQLCSPPKIVSRPQNWGRDAPGRSHL